MKRNNLCQIYPMLRMRNLSTPGKGAKTRGPMHEFAYKPDAPNPVQ
jgi:hypothetical protein